MIDRVLALKSHCPDAEEVKLLQSKQIHKRLTFFFFFLSEQIQACANFEGDENDLDIPEKFVRCIGSVKAFFFFFF